MKNYKISTLILAALLCFGALSGCGEKKQEGPTLIPADSAEVEAVLGSSNAEYIKGNVENNLYTSGSGDVQLRVPEGWMVYDEYQLATMMQLPYDFEDPDAYAEEAASLSYIYDFVMTDTTEDFTVMVTLENLGENKMTPSEYLELGKASLTTENASYEVVEDISEVSFSGNSYSMLKLEATPTEGTAATQYIFAREDGERMMTVMLTFPSDEPINPDTIFA